MSYECVGPWVIAVWRFDFIFNIVRGLLQTLASCCPRLSANPGVMLSMAYCNPWRHAVHGLLQTLASCCPWLTAIPGVMLSVAYCKPWCHAVHGLLQTLVSCCPWLIANPCVMLPARGLLQTQVSCRPWLIANTGVMLSMAYCKPWRHAVHGLVGVRLACTCRCGGVGHLALAFGGSLWWHAWERHEGCKA